MMYGILVLVILILFSGYFSASETAFTSLSVLQIQDIKKRRPRRGRLIEKTRKHPENYLTTVLVVSNLVNILASVLATQLTLEHFGDAFLGVSTGILTLVVLVFCEVTPKRLAISHNEFICAYSIDLLIVLSWILRPAVYVIGVISFFITRLFGSAPGQKITLQGVIHLVNLAQEDGILEDDTTQMMKSIIHFDEVKVQAIMTHRTEVFSLPAEQTAREALDRVVEKDHSRLPVYEENPENITGIVLTKDIWKAAYEGRGDAALKSLAMDPTFVSAQTSVYRLFSILKKNKANLVVALDEYGGLAGIVTYEDLIEEITGQVYEEDEEEEAAGKTGQQPDGSWRISGGTPLQMANDSLGTSFPVKKTSQTLGGFLLDLGGSIPPAGEKIATDEGYFVIEKITRGRIILARYFPQPREEGEEE